MAPGSLLDVKIAEGRENETAQASPQPSGVPAVRVTQDTAVVKHQNKTGFNTRVSSMTFFHTF